MRCLHQWCAALTMNRDGISLTDGVVALGKEPNKPKSQKEEESRTCSDESKPQPQTESVNRRIHTPTLPICHGSEIAKSDVASNLPNNTPWQLDIFGSCTPKTNVRESKCWKSPSLFSNFFFADPSVKIKDLQSIDLRVSILQNVKSVKIISAQGCKH